MSDGKNFEYPFKRTTTTGKMRIEAGWLFPRIMMEESTQHWKQTASHAILLGEVVSWRKASRKDIKWLFSLFEHNGEFDLNQLLQIRRIASSAVAEAKALRESNECGTGSAH